MIKLVASLRLRAAVTTLVLAACGGGGGGGADSGSAGTASGGTGSGGGAAGGTTPVVLRSGLGIFMVNSGGVSTEFLGYDSSGNSISVDSTTYKYSLLIPGTRQLVVLSSHTSQSFASFGIYPFAQGDRVFRIRQASGATGAGSISELDLATNAFVGDAVIGQGLNPDRQFALVGDRAFFREAGGQLKTQPSIAAPSPFPATLLFSSASDNPADSSLIGDSGNLYAVRHDTAAGRLTVHLRNQSTGSYAAQLLDLPTPEQANYQCCWSFKINSGILYAARERNDGAFEILSLDLATANLASPLVPLVTFTASDGVFKSFAGLWGVDNGRIAVAGAAPGTAPNPVTVIADSLVVYENGVVTRYSLGAGASIVSLAVVFRN